MALIFFSMIGLFSWLWYKYFTSISSTASIANKYGVRFGSFDSHTNHLTGSMLMADATFSIELIKGSYRSMGYPIDVVQSLDKARVYLLWQIPTVLTGFLTPVINARM